MKAIKTTVYEANDGTMFKDATSAVMHDCKLIFLSEYVDLAFPLEKDDLANGQSIAELRDDASVVYNWLESNRDAVGRALNLLPANPVKGD